MARTGSGANARTSSPSRAGATNESNPLSKRRYQVTLTGEALANAEALATAHGVSIGEACRRGLAVLRFLSDEEDKGSGFQLQTALGDTERIRIIYA